MADQIALPASLIKTSMYVYRFPLPATKLIKFEECFARNLGVEETAKAVSSMEQARDDLARELVSGTPNYANAAAGAKRYIPLITLVLSSLEKSSDPVYLNKPLSFTWATGIGQSPRTGWVTNQAVVWDKCMALASQALSHADLVHNLLENDLSEKFTEAGQHLRIAAGIFEALHKVELPRWVGETAEAPRLLEVEPSICEGLVKFCLAEAQQMAVGKALVAGTTPPTLVARLCFGVVSLLESTVSIMRSSATNAYGRLDPPFLLHVTFQMNLYKGLAHRFLAASAWAKDEYGLGIALMNQACAYVNERTDATSVGTPPLTGPLRGVMREMWELQAEFKSIRDSYFKDNNTIYYMLVPSLDMVDEPLPDPVIMMKPLPVPPGPEIPKLLVFGGQGAGGGSDEDSKASAAPVAGAEGEKAGDGDGGVRDRTDEELARELNKMLNG